MTAEGGPSVPELRLVDDGLTACGHRRRSEACKMPDGPHNGPIVDGNPFEADGHERCSCCGLAVCGEPTFKDRHAAYEDSGDCAPCFMATEGLDVQDLVAICDRGGW